MAGKRVIIDASGELAELTNGEDILLLVERLAADPVTDLIEGRIYWNTSSKKFRKYNGSGWSDLDSGGGGGGDACTLNHSIALANG